MVLKPYREIEDAQATEEALGELLEEPGLLASPPHTHHYNLQNTKVSRFHEYHPLLRKTLEQKHEHGG